MKEWSQEGTVIQKHMSLLQKEAEVEQRVQEREKPDSKRKRQEEEQPLQTTKDAKKQKVELFLFVERKI